MGNGARPANDLAAELSPGPARLLVADDEPFLRDAVAASLRFLGFEVATAENGASALRLARDRRFDLIVLDVMMPDTDGFEIVRRLRRDGCGVPVIFLTARDTQDDKVTGLTIGGDDYLTKPFGLEELAARIATVLRRTRPDSESGAVLTFADVELNQDTYEVRRGGYLIELSPTEFRLLRYLMINPARVLTRAQFFADASHELRNPLASLRANAELYQQGAIPGRAGADEAMNRIALEARRMSKLVDDMLRLARLDQHPGQQRDRVDLTGLVAGCAGRWQGAFPGRAWYLEIADDLVAEGDEEMLRRAIDNLLANVCAHTPEGTTGTIVAARHDETVHIEVSDDGPGVPASHLPRIFDRFYRAGASPQRPGSGLGLAIVAAIAAAHGGSAQAALNQPHGLRVTLTVPSRRPARHERAGSGP